MASKFQRSRPRKIYPVMSVPIGKVRWNDRQTAESEAYFEDLRRGDPITPIVQLHDDIRQRGMINPLIVQEGDDESYVVAIGNRRLAIAHILGMGDLCVIVVPVGAHLPTVMSDNYAKVSDD